MLEGYSCLECSWWAWGSGGLRRALLLILPPLWAVLRPKQVTRAFRRGQPEDGGEDSPAGQASDAVSSTTGIAWPEWPALHLGPCRHQQAGQGPPPQHTPPLSQASSPLNNAKSSCYTLSNKFSCAIPPQAKPGSCPVACRLLSRASSTSSTHEHRTRTRHSHLLYMHPLHKPPSGRWDCRSLAVRGLTPSTGKDSPCPGRFPTAAALSRRARSTGRRSGRGSPP
jgi:hypothetical protein